MSAQKRTFMEREYTRRQFMKMTGKGLAGVALSSSLLQLMGVTQAQADAGQVSVYAEPDFLLVVNRAKCTGCQRCEVNCTLQNDGNLRPYMARIRVADNLNFGNGGVTENFEEGEGIFGDWTFAPDTCKQCKDPWCANACPVKAIYADEKTGTRIVNEEVCIGCGACVQACPWHMPRLNPETRKSSKCINCGACVAGCPTSALKMVSWEDVAQVI